jgi:hypothetical protein
MPQFDLYLRVENMPDEKIWKIVLMDSAAGPCKEAALSALTLSVLGGSD